MVKRNVNYNNSALKILGGGGGGGGTPVITKLLSEKKEAKTKTKLKDLN